MNKAEKYQHLQNGGKLIRKGTGNSGKPIIKVKTKDKDWHTLCPYSTEEERDKAFSIYLLFPNMAED